MNNKSVPFKETLYLAIGEAAVSAIVVAVFLIIGKYNFTVLTGACLGSLVTVLNFLFLSISVNNAIDKALENAPRSPVTVAEDSSTFSEELAEVEREVLVSGLSTGECAEGTEPDGAAASCDQATAEHSVETLPDEPDLPDEAELFAAQYAAQVQNSVKLSYIIRTVSMLAALVLSFVLGRVFNVIATVVPLLMFRPVLTVESLIRGKLAEKRLGSVK